MEHPPVFADEVDDTEWIRRFGTKEQGYTEVRRRVGAMPVSCESAESESCLREVCASLRPRPGADVTAIPELPLFELQRVHGSTGTNVGEVWLSEDGTVNFFGPECPKASGRGSHVEAKAVAELVERARAEKLPAAPREGAGCKDCSSETLTLRLDGAASRLAHYGEMTPLGAFMRSVHKLVGINPCSNADQREDEWWSKRESSTTP